MIIAFNALMLRHQLRLVVLVQSGGNNSMEYSVWGTVYVEKRSGVLHLPQNRGR